MHNNNSHIDIDKLLDDALKSDPGFDLSVDFADKLAERVSRRFAWQQYIKEFAIYLGVVVGILVVMMTVQIFVVGADWHRWLSFISKNLSLVIGTNILLVFILFADRVLLQYFMFRASGDQL